MRKLLAVLFVIASGAASAMAQQRPLSPPDRPPVPLSDLDQARTRDESLQHASAVAKSQTPGQSGVVTIPASILAGHHMTSGNAAIDAIVNEAASRYRVDPCLILSVMHMESGYNRNAVSPKGASGLMQLMPETAARFGVRNIFDARENVMAGANYLRWLLDRFGDVRLALAGYNAGEGSVALYGNRIPPFLETQNYVQVIYARYSHAHSGLEPSAAGPGAEQIVQSASAEKPPTYNQIIRFTSSVPETGASGGSQR
jgi:soluble lytic murein transglycosylase-like protein